MDDIELWKGDCRKLMQNIQNKSVSLICADLPYGTSANKWDSVISLDFLWEQYERILSIKGNIVLFGTGLFAFRLALSNEKLFRYDMIWKKSKCGSPFTAKYMPLKKHELLLVFGKPASYYNPQMVDGAPYSRISKREINNMQYGAKEGFLYGSRDGKRHPDTIRDFPQKWRRQDQIHPTQKPVELLEWIVSSYSRQGDLVLDNVMGSGTTGVACINTNRRFIGIEKDEKYFNIAKERIDKSKIL
jgi:site-specific DNA-methyltransferase (adenine-specific)